MSTSTETLIEALEKLYQLHEKLYELSETKTEIIKKGDMEGLQKMLKDEQTFVAAINTMEKQRQEAAKQLLGKSEATEITLTNCIEAVTGNDKKILNELKEKIWSVVNKLKDRNELNQLLIHQSLQFVNMTIDMIQPRPESMNYGRPDQKKMKKPTVSTFNSKA